MSNSKNNSTPVDAPIEIVVADIGGTNARFAIAKIQNGQVVTIDSETIL